MLFNANFSFGPKAALQQDQKISGSLQNRRQGSVGDGELQLSPSSRIRTSPGVPRDPLSRDPPRDPPPDFFLNSPTQVDRLFTTSPSYTSSRTSQLSLSPSLGSESTTLSSLRPSTAGDSTLTLPRMIVTRSRSASPRRRGRDDPFGTGSERRTPGLVIGSATAMDIRSLKRIPKQISVPPRTTSRNQTDISSFPMPSSASSKLSYISTQEPSSFPKPKTPQNKHSDRGLLPPFGQLSPRTRELEEQPVSSDRTSAADYFGLQMLVDTLNEDSDQEEEEEEARESERSFRNLSSSNRRLSLRSRPSLPRVDIPMPSIEECGETGSDSSTISDYGPTTPVSLGRSTSIVSTALASAAMPETPSTLGVPKQRRVSSISPSAGSFLFDGTDEDTLRSDASRRSIASEASPLSRRSSMNTFFCQGNRGSSMNNGRFSIGLGSIAASDIDLEAGLDDTTYYPGMDELKKQISWLSMKTAGCYDSDEYDSDDSDYYHAHLARTVSRKASSARQVERPPSPTPAPYPAPTGPVMTTPPPRRTRRRTASSECLVLDALEKMLAADKQDSINAVLGVRVEPQAQLPKKNSRSSFPPTLPQLDVVELEPWDGMFQDYQIFTSTTAWDRMLDRDSSLGFC